MISKKLDLLFVVWRVWQAHRLCRKDHLQLPVQIHEAIFTLANTPRTTQRKSKHSENRNAIHHRAEVLVFVRRHIFLPHPPQCQTDRDNGTPHADRKSSPKSRPP